MNKMPSNRSLLLLLIPSFSCASMKDPEGPGIPFENEGYFFTSGDGCKLFVYDYQPVENYKSTIYIISGITGINHRAEKEIIRLLGNHENRVVVIHPRGTGFSEGRRGDISNFQDFINDYTCIISSDKDYNSAEHKTVLFGHSMSTAVLLAVAGNLKNTGGAILINPPYIMKKARGMSPGFGEYIKYAWFYLFSRHKPIVNMAGNPSAIADEEDRNESLARMTDPMLVKYFSLHMMMESKRIMDSMVVYAKTADYPLLLICGDRDNIVDRKGCDLIYKAWKCERKQYKTIKNGSHGKSTVMLSGDFIHQWLKYL